MIFDRLDRADVYRCLGGRLARALDYLRQADLGALAPGEYPVAGREVLAMVQEAPTRPPEQGRWEAHRRYVDIQYVIRGVERMGVADVGALVVTEPYDPAQDVLMLDGKGGTFLDVHPGQFCIFFPHDAHMPGLSPGAPNVVKKVVMKVVLD